MQLGDECIYYEDGAIVVDIEVTSEGLIKYLVLEVNGRDRVIVERSEVLEGEITRLEAVPKEQPSKPLDVIHVNPGGDGAVDMDEEGGGDELNAPPCTPVLLTACRRRSPPWLPPPSRSRSSLPPRGSTPSGSEAPSWLPSPPSSRCGSPSRSTTSAAHPSSTASASKCKNLPIISNKQSNDFQ